MGTSATLQNGKKQKVKKSVVLPDDWAAWTSYLATRKKPKPLAKVIGDVPSVLTWPLEDAWHGSDSAKLVRQLERIGLGQSSSNGDVAGQLQKWLEAAPRREVTPSFAIEAIAWAHALPQLGSTLPSAPWHQLLDQLDQLSRDAVGIPAESQPLVHQLLAGELPLTLAYYLPELELAEGWQADGQQQLSQAVLELTDGEGLMRAQCISLCQPLLACWTRCGYLGKASKRASFTAEARLQLEWLVQQSLRLTRSDGSKVFTRGLSGAACRPLTEAALKLFGDSGDRRAAAVANSTKAKKRKQKLPPPAVHSEWAQVGLLRTGWEKEHDSLNVTYHDSKMVLELNAHGQTILDGAWGFELRVDGQPVTVQNEWTEVCSQADEDGDYLELEIDLSDGRMLQRQMFLARKDRFAYLSDAILGETPNQLDYVGTLPLAEAARFVPATETQEGFLATRKRQGLLLPLALPEWRSERGAGGLQAEEDEVRYQLSTRGTSLCAPLFIDLDTKRIKKQVTWRRLTVAERLDIQPTDVAVGFRVQVSQAQWLIYRSLSPRRSRSVLGQNFTSEFVLARFSREGECDKYVEIE